MNKRTSKRPAGGSRDAKGSSSVGAHADVVAAVADYERDDDFQFVRKSKRHKAEDVEPVKEPVKKPRKGRPAAKDRVAEVAEPVADAPAPPVATGRRSSRRKPSIDASNKEPLPDPPNRPPRRSARLSGDNVAEEPQVNGASRSHARSKRTVSPPPRVAEEPPSPQHEESVQSAKIALPMSDTPIINRNKEMRRKGNSNRRSSLSSRGRRASSLIESGQSATPHHEVNPAEFYKHIAADGLIEPRRMRQLLTWCGERALSEKPPHGTPNSSAILGGRWRYCPRGASTQMLTAYSTSDSRSDSQGLFNPIRVLGLVQQR
jgi:kinetochore protein Mis13/DSN1